MYRRHKIEAAKFDWEFYTSHYEDLNYIKNENNAWDHYRKYGLKEDRFPNQNKYEEFLKIGKIPGLYSNSNNKTIFKNKDYKPIVSIVMAYYNRKSQTLETLRGFEKMYTSKYNFEVVIVDDNSNEDHQLENDINQFSFPINLIVITKEEKSDLINPCMAYNKGFKEAKGEIIIIQNPECYHLDNILDDTMTNLQKNKIISYSCYGLASFEQNKLILSPDILKQSIKNINKIGGQDKSIDNLSVSGWLNDKKINPTYYHYCLSIYKSDLNLLGGFSIDLRHGFCYDDDEFIRRAYYKKFEMSISDLLVIHQFHEPFSVPTSQKQKLHFINFQIMKEKSKRMDISLEKQFIPEYHNKNNLSEIPKIAFSYWSGRNFSYLNLLSIETFCFYNPSYKFILYTDLDFSSDISNLKEFNTNEHDINPTILNNYLQYIDELKKIYNIEVNVISKLNKKKCIIINADYYRIYFLYNQGGIWVDLDIIHLKPIDEVIFDKKNIFIHKYEYTDTITTGIIGSSKLNPKIKPIYDEIEKKVNGSESFNDYQEIGPSLITKYKHLFEKSDYIESRSFYPIEWYDIQEYYKDVNFNIDFYGVHWFNGSNYTKKYIEKFEDLFYKKNIIDDKYCFFGKLIKKFYIDKYHKYSIDYINFNFIPFVKFKEETLFKKINLNDKTLDELAIICENNKNYICFDTNKNVYINEQNIMITDYDIKNDFIEYIQIENNINGIYIKNNFKLIQHFPDNLSLQDGVYVQNNKILNRFEKKILYVTNEEEFSEGYGQLFRKDRLLSLKNDDRFDCADIKDNFYDNKCYYNSHKALITTHECIRIEDKHPSDDTIHWCPHSLCGHDTVNKHKSTWTFDSFKSYMNLLSLKTEQISHRFIILEDMHYYTFRGSKDNFYRGIDNLCKYIDKYYNFVIYHYENSELEIIKKTCKNVIKFYNLPHHVNTDVYKKYTEEKEYDILFYGSCDPTYYPLRYKIKQALLKSDLNYIILEKPNNWNELNDNVLDKLSTKINKAYITITCASKFNYAVVKYFEIAASNSVIAGDACPIIESIFGDNMIKLSNSMTEDEIITILKNNLINKKALVEKSNNMYKIIHENFNLSKYNDKLEQIVEDSLKCNVVPFNKEYGNETIQNTVSGFNYIYLYYPNLTKEFTIDNEEYYFNISDNSLSLFKNNIKFKTFDSIKSDDIKIIKILKTPTNDLHVFLNNKRIN
jgi:hypothetical protein